MGGGGGFFGSIAQVIGDVVNTLGGVVGKDNIMDTPAQQKQAAENAAKAQQEQFKKAQADLQQRRDTMKAAEGGTPTANASQSAKQAGSAAALSESQQAVNQTSGSGTMLTGPTGVDPQLLELGRKTLLGG